MKTRFTCCMLLLTLLAGAQVTITEGGSLYLTGNSSLTMEGIGFTNNGLFSAGSGEVMFTGSSNNSISGSSDVSFYELHIYKQGGEVLLQRPINVFNRILFSEGNLFIGNHDVNLGSTGILQGENDQQRLRTSGSGEVVARRILNNVVNAMPGNLGLSITTSQNLGQVIVRRGHLAQSGSGLTTSILRYYKVEPQLVPNTMDATIRMSYLDAELNDIDENVLQLYQSEDGTAWTSLGFTTQQTSANYVELTDVAALNRFTLASLVVLPVQFVAINGQCRAGKAIINWQTAQEQNSQQFDVQRSTGGTWTTIGSLPAAGNSFVQKSYSFTDNNPLAEGLYRIAQKGKDGRQQYSSVVRITCGDNNSIRVWPNPVAATLSVQLHTASAQKIRLQLYDAKGARAKEQFATVQRGANVLQMDFSRLASGLYSLLVIGDQGQRLLSTSVSKQ